MPAGYLCATWIALEDVDDENGPLVYYPGSHKLAEYTLADVGCAPDVAHYPRYERFVAQMIAGRRLQPRTATIRKGQAVVWAGNLLHGGSPRATSPEAGTARRPTTSSPGAVTTRRCGAAGPHLLATAALDPPAPGHCGEPVAGLTSSSAATCRRTSACTASTFPDASMTRIFSGWRCASVRNPVRTRR